MGMRFSILVRFLVLSSLLGSWLVAMGMISSISKQISLQSRVNMDTKICRSIPGLTKSQIELCYKQPDTTTAAVKGLELAVLECENQLQGHRWNCSSLVPKARNPHTSPMFQQGYRETAFLHAISAAGVAISVSKACVEGNLMNCGCDPKKYKPKGIDSKETPPWKWGGCSHNIKFGVRFSRLFLDSREKGGSMGLKINKHNNRVGRMAVSNNMQMKCKCHGLSGSCDLKTCWRTVPDFKMVGKLLRGKYQDAILVDHSNLGSQNLKRFNNLNQRRRKQHLRLKEWTPRKRNNKRDLSLELLFYQKSPDYCDLNKNLDVPGTIGRVCNSTITTGLESCSSLCCGRGYDLVKHRKTESCNCVFIWCCEVKCELCTTEEWISVCK